MNAVIFDCDGVLVDSEPVVADAWIEVLGPRGLTVTTSDTDQCVGRSFVETLEFFVAMGLATTEGLAEELEATIARRYETELTPFTDAADTAAGLALVGTRLAVASSSPRARLDRALGITGVGRYFETTAAGDEVDQPKPSPDVYLLAAERLNVDPSACLAIEDTTSGVEAANRAGMRVVAIDRSGTAAGELMAAGASVVRRLDPDVVLLWLRN